jgi:predicted  nucleic acid-binding Zn-ribbon protein
MYSAEVLSQLRSLNHLSHEILSLPQESPEAVLLQKQIGALRARLPNSILSYHDRLAARGQASVAKVNGESCSACHLKLPRGLFCELAVPGRFGVCTNCGVFLWMGEKPAEPVPVPVRKPARRSVAKVSV